MAFKATLTISASERSRLLDYLIFKLQHGGDVIAALISYMEGNHAKSSQPVKMMLDEIKTGMRFPDAALKYKLVDKFGYLIVSSGISPAKTLPVLKETAINASRGVTAIIYKEVVAKILITLGLAYGFSTDLLRQPLLTLYSAMNNASATIGASEGAVPAYLQDPFLVFKCAVLGVLGIGLISVGLWWANKFKTELIYRFAKFRFYEDWAILLSLFVAFKAAGQSDYQVTKGLAEASLDGSFNQRLFREVGDRMKTKGDSFYEALNEHKDVIPHEVLSFFLDAAKTGRISDYMEQARDFCMMRVNSMRDIAAIWAPVATGVTILLVFGGLLSNLFVSITKITLNPIIG